MSRHYECKACRYSASITDEGVDAMREHIKTAHLQDPPKVRRDAYVVIRSR